MYRLTTVNGDFGEVGLAECCSARVCASRSAVDSADVGGVARMMPELRCLEELADVLLVAAGHVHSLAVLGEESVPPMGNVVVASVRVREVAGRGARSLYPGEILTAAGIDAATFGSADIAGGVGCGLIGARRCGVRVHRVDNGRCWDALLLGDDVHGSVEVRPRKIWVHARISSIRVSSALATSGAEKTSSAANMILTTLTFTNVTVADTVGPLSGALGQRS